MGEGAYMEGGIPYYYHTRRPMYTLYTMWTKQGLAAVRATGRQPLSTLRPRRRQKNKNTLFLFFSVLPRELPTKSHFPNTARFAILSWYPQLVVPGTRSRGNHATLGDEAGGTEMNTRVRDGTIPIHCTKWVYAPESASIVARVDFRSCASLRSEPSP